MFAHILEMSDFILFFYYNCSDVPVRSFSRLIFPMLINLTLYNSCFCSVWERAFMSSILNHQPNDALKLSELKQHLEVIQRWQESRWNFPREKVMSFSRGSSWWVSNYSQTNHSVKQHSPERSLFGLLLSCWKNCVCVFVGGQLQWLWSQNRR